MAKKKNNIININLENPDDINKFLNRVVQELISGQQSNQPNPANPFVTGFSIKIDKAGVQITDAPQMITQNGTEVKQKPQEREPLIDIIDRPSGVSVIAEIPGISKANIEVSTNGINLKISATEHQRSYNKALTLPQCVDPKTGSASYNNGILEVNFNKGNYKGKPISILVK